MQIIQNLAWNTLKLGNYIPVVQNGLKRKAVELNLRIYCTFLPIKLKMTMLFVSFTERKQFNK